MPMALRYVNSPWHEPCKSNGVKDPLASYGPENVAKIRAAATKYDPKQVFQKRVPGGFKISKVNEARSKTEL